MAFTCIKQGFDPEEKRFLPLLGHVATLGDPVRLLPVEHFNYGPLKRTKVRLNLKFIAQMTF